MSESDPFWPAPAPERSGSEPSLREEMPTWPGTVMPFDELAKPGSLVPVVEQKAAEPEPAVETERDSVWSNTWKRRWAIAGLAALSFTTALLGGLWSTSRREAQEVSEVGSAAQVSAAVVSPVPPSPSPPALEESPAVPVAPPTAAAAPEPAEPVNVETKSGDAPAPPGAARRKLRTAAPAAPQRLYTPNRI